jgi:hypothetical protein
MSPSMIGGRTLLTDPQIITSPYVLFQAPRLFSLILECICSETGRIFADGNLPSTHLAFTTDHICNRICQFFNLEPFDQLFAESSLLPHKKLFAGLSDPLPPKASSTRRSQDEMPFIVQDRVVATCPSQLHNSDGLSIGQFYPQTT